MNIGIAHLQPIVSLIAGILISIMPRLLNYIVAVFLIIKKKAAFWAAFFTLRNEVKLGLVDDLFDGILGLTDGFLRFALELLRSAFNLKGRVAYRLADALLDCPSSLIGQALNLVGSAVHDFSPE